MSTIEKAIDRLVREDEHPRVLRAADSNVATPKLQEGTTDRDDPAQSAVFRDTGLGSPPASETEAESATGDRAASERLAKTFEDAEPMTALPVHGLGLEGFISPQAERSRTAEEFRMIKRPLLQRAFSGEVAAGARANVIAVTSSIAGEGKTFTSLNLAISIAMELDRTVLLVDADLANPGLSRLLRTQDLPGLTERLLEEKVDLKSLLRHTDVPKLTLLPAGRRHRRSTELLASNAMKELVDELATRYSDRVVLFDSPPLLATSEASVLAEQAGQICLVVESATTPQFLVKEALGLLRHQDRVSLVLNKTRDELLSGRSGYYYGYRYNYGYGRGYGTDDAAA
jgi:exopolysaccharide/PEP-CTERM locus tyrosine autokinase